MEYMVLTGLEEWWLSVLYLTLRGLEMGERNAKKTKRRPRRKTGGAIVLQRYKFNFLVFAKVDFDVPAFDPHGAILSKVLLHFEGTIE